MCTNLTVTALLVRVNFVSEQSNNVGPSKVGTLNPTWFDSLGRGLKHFGVISTLWASVQTLNSLW